MQHLITWLCHPTCLLCALPVDSAHLICEECDQLLPRTNMDASSPIFSLFQYQPPISTWIARLKFYGDLKMARFFAKKFTQHCFTSLPDLIMPVPLHPNRLKERGFNQSLEIAKPIGKHFKIPIDIQSCIRIKNTNAQSSLPASQRKKNMKNAFLLSRPIHKKHVAILDDVITTGSTIAEISNLLKLAGVETISVWCCAKTIL